MTKWHTKSSVGWMALAMTIWTDDWARLPKKPMPSLPAAQQLLKDADIGTQHTTANVGITSYSNNHATAEVCLSLASPK